MINHHKHWKKRHPEYNEVRDDPRLSAVFRPGYAQKKAEERGVVKKERPKKYDVSHRSAEWTPKPRKSRAKPEGPPVQVHSVPLTFPNPNPNPNPP